MASAVETQRLISVSLGKIARSRAQRGGINLHKNLLVASVLNKARTAFMMENYSCQLPQQQQKHVILTTPQPNPTTPIEQRDGNSLSSELLTKTCPTKPETENRSAPQATPEHVSGASAVLTNVMTDSHDKENMSPSTDSCVMDLPDTVEQIECKQQCVSGEQHIEAANQLSYDVQFAGSRSHAKQSSTNTTCSGVLKRRRVNLEAQSVCDSDCPANKKCRATYDLSFSQTHQTCDIPTECESESRSDIMQTSDSPQISNLVSIFNSGFSGLCNVSPSPSSLEYDSYQSDTSSVSHQWSNSRNSSENQSLHCSSMVERIGSISAAIVLSA